MNRAQTLIKQCEAQTCLIKTPDGYVKSFDKKGQKVLFVSSSNDAKAFGMTAALNFIGKYADEGFGLDSKTAVVEPQ